MTYELNYAFEAIDETMSLIEKPQYYIGERSTLENISHQRFINIEFITQIYKYRTKLGDLMQIFGEITKLELFESLSNLQGELCKFFIFLDNCCVSNCRDYLGEIKRLIFQSFDELAQCLRSQRSALMT